jgi:hypothetical protein
MLRALCDAMPYYLHLKTEPLDIERLDDYYPYNIRQDAVDSLSLLPNCIIAFHPSQSELDAFHTRENGRFGKGEYRRVPWADEPWPEECCEHFPHMAIKGDSGLIAYTKTVENGVRDIQTRIRPGRYLQQFYSHIPKDQRDKWIAECQAVGDPLQIATSRADILAVYEGGPYSCMSGSLNGPKARYWHWDTCPMPPVAAYGDSDFGVVYTGPMDKAKGRCVVRLAEKTFTRIYGDVDKIAFLLHQHGYTLGTLYGARLRAIDADYGYLAPYVDGLAKNEDGNPHRDGENREHVAGELSDDGQWIVLGECGDLEVTSTGGRTEEAPAEESDNSDDDDYRTCDRCDNECSADETYCSRCYDNATRCDHCDELTWDGITTTPQDRQLCEDCEGTERRDCLNCNERFYRNDFNYVEKARRQREGTTDYCAECAPEFTQAVDTPVPSVTVDIVAQAAVGRTHAVAPPVPLPIPRSVDGWRFFTDNRSPSWTNGTIWYHDGRNGWYTQNRRFDRTHASSFMDRPPDWFVEIPDPRVHLAAAEMETPF